MSKKKRKNRKARKQENIKTRPQKPKAEAGAVTDTSPSLVDVRTDLRKTAILTAVCLGILFALFLTQSRWSALSLRF